MASSSFKEWFWIIKCDDFDELFEITIHDDDGELFIQGKFTRLREAFIH